MSVLDQIRRAATQVGRLSLPGSIRADLAGAIEVRSITQLPDAFLGGWSTPSGATISPENATTIADVYAFMRVIADAAGSLPLATYRRTDEGRQKIDAGFVSPLLRKPAPYMTQQVFVSTLITNLLGWGNAFIPKFREGGRIVQLGTITPSRVTVSTVGGEPRFTVTRDASDTVAGTFGPRDILHVKAMSLDGLLGLSPIRQARNALGLARAQEDFAGYFMANQAAPGGIIQLPDGKELSADAAKRLKADWERAHRGAENLGRVAVLEDGATWHQIGLPLDDVQFIEQRKMSATEIARIFRVPPHMIGAESGSSMTYSNVEQESANFVMHTLRPWLVAIEQALACDPDLFPADGSTYPEFLIDALLRADTQARFAAYGMAHGKWMSTNDIRRRENLNDIEGGDEMGTTSKYAEAEAFGLAAQRMGLALNYGVASDEEMRPLLGLDGEGPGPAGSSPNPTNGGDDNADA